MVSLWNMIVSLRILSQSKFPCSFYNYSWHSADSKSKWSQDLGKPGSCIPEFYPGFYTQCTIDSCYSASEGHKTTWADLLEYSQTSIYCSSTYRSSMNRTSIYRTSIYRTSIYCTSINRVPPFTGAYSFPEILGFCVNKVSSNYIYPAPLYAVRFCLLPKAQ